MIRVGNLISYNGYPAIITNMKQTRIKKVEYYFVYIYSIKSKAIYKYKYPAEYIEKYSDEWRLTELS